MLRSFAKGASVYAVMLVVRKSIPFVLAPVLTHFLSQEDYGIVSVFRVSVPLVLAFISLQGTSALTRFFFERDEHEIAEMTGDALKINFVMAGAIILLSFVFSDFLGNLLKIPSYLIPLIPLIGLFSSLSNVLLERLRVLEKAFSFGAIQIFNTLLNFGVTIGLVVFLGWKWEGRVTAIVFTEVLLGIAAFYLLFRFGFFRFRKGLKDGLAILRFSLPLVPNQVSKKMLSSTERYFLVSIVGLSATGLYSVAAAFGSVMLVIHQSLNQAWTPILFKELSKGDLESKRNTLRVLLVYSLAVSALGIGMFFFIPFLLPLVVGESFHEAARFVPWIIAAYTFTGLRGSVAPLIRFAKRTEILAYTSIAVMVSHLFVAFFLIRENGLLGAAQATLVTCAFEYVLTAAMAIRLARIPGCIFQEKTP